MLKLIICFYGLLSLTLISSCKMVNVKYGNMSAKNYIENNKNNATTLYEQGNIKEAVEVLNKTIDNFMEEKKYSFIIEDMYLKLITWQIEIGEDKKAKVRANYFLKNFPKSDKVPLIVDLFDSNRNLKSSVIEKPSEEKQINIEEPLPSMPVDSNTNTVLDDILLEQDKPKDNSNIEHQKEELEKKEMPKINEHTNQELKTEENKPSLPTNTEEEKKDNTINKNDIFDEAKKSDSVIMNDLLNHE